ncbi:MAG: hypothetical protein AAGF90_10320 [Pseudomonadota bacterium]
MEFLTKELLLAFLVGTTHHVDTGKPAEAAIYYEDEDTAHMRLPSGDELSGEWRLTEEGYHIAWEGGPSGEWRVAKTAERIFYVDAKGDERGDVTRISPGDAADLAD